MAELDIDSIKELRKNHLKNLKNIFEASIQNCSTDQKPLENIHIENNQLKEYFQYMYNSIDSTEALILENQKTKKLKLNENIIKEQQMNQKRFDIDWNLDYCNACKTSYWPLNCTVYIEPKCRFNKKSGKLVTKYKLFNYKPKYKSYKDRLLKNLLKKGIKLIYFCKRCKAKNIILNEMKRSETKEVKLNKVENKKHINKLIKSSEFTFNKNKMSSSDSKHQFSNGNILINKRVSVHKKFQSLQENLKKNELQQVMINKDQEKNKNRFGSLADFLQQIT